MQPIKVSLIIQHSSGGQFGICQCPGKRLEKGRDGKSHIHDIREDLQYFKNLGISLIVCLLNDSEIRSVGLNPALYRETAQRYQIEFIQYPIYELAPPDSIESFEQTVLTPLANAVTDGRFAIAHCRGGIGRAGTTAACMLKKLGSSLTAAEAIASVRKKRDKRCVESRGQEDFIKRYFSL